MRVALVVNRSSGSATDAEAVAAKLRAHGAEVIALDIADVEDAGRAARPERLVVAGGDGSVAPVAALAAELGVPLAVVPAGTANDFARALALPRNVADACALAADPRARTARLQLARADDRPFVNAASCGLSVTAAHRAGPLKPRLGVLAYAVGALLAGVTGHPIRARVAGGDRTMFEGDAWQVIVGATGAFGGGSGIEEADPGDHLLDVVVVAAGARIGLVPRAFGLRTGRIARQRGVIHAQAPTIRVDVAADTAWNVDGELAELGGASFASAGESYRVVVG